MDDYEANQFLLDMQEENLKVFDLEDAITFAMSCVPEYDGGRWCGPIGEGVFFADHDRFLWYPQTHFVEAVGLIAVEFGTSLTEGFLY